MKRQIIAIVMSALTALAGNALAYYVVTPSQAGPYIVKEVGAFILDVRLHRSGIGLDILTYSISNGFLN